MEIGIEETGDDEPVLTIFRTNGLIWAAFDVYADGIEEPSDVFATRRDMHAHARRRFPVKIEYRPTELGCEASEEERAAVPILAAAYDVLIKFGRLQLA